MRDLLISAGLTQNEAEIYLVLLRKGCSSATDVVKELGMHRTSVYNTLARLESKGLVNAVMINKLRRFTPAHPQKLKQSVADQMLIMEQLLPNLEHIHDERQRDEHIQYFTGVTGLQSIYEMILGERKNYLGYGPALRAEKLLSHYLVRFTKQAVKEKMRSRMIYHQQFEELMPNPLEERRYLASGELSPESVMVFGDMVAIMFFSSEAPAGMVIQNKAMADGFRERFEHLWERAEQ